MIDTEETREVFSGGIPGFLIEISIGNLVKFLRPISLGEVLITIIKPIL